MGECGRHHDMALLRLVPVVTLEMRGMSELDIYNGI